MQREDRHVNNYNTIHGVWEQRMPICLRKLDRSNTLWMNYFDGQEIQRANQCKDRDQKVQSMKNIDEKFGLYQQVTG